MVVAFLKGINVGGHRRFRPSMLANELKRLDIVSVGATGTFVVRTPVSKTKLRREIARRLPFDAEIMICDGRDVLRLIAANPFAGQRRAADIIQFVSILARRPRRGATFPLDIPAARWCVKVLGRQDRFVYGLHRRQMAAIGQLGQLEKVFGTRTTTRSWSTIQAIAAVLQRA